MQLSPGRFAHDLVLSADQLRQRLRCHIPRRVAQRPDRLDRERAALVEVKVPVLDRRPIRLTTLAQLRQL